MLQRVVVQLRSVPPFRVPKGDTGLVACTSHARARRFSGFNAGFSSTCLCDMRGVRLVFQCFGFGKRLTSRPLEPGVQKLYLETIPFLCCSNETVKL